MAAISAVIVEVLVLLLLTNSASASAYIVRASEIGAKLDSDLYTGGGTDDTSSLQMALNEAVQLGRIHLVIDGPALVSGLDVYGNTIVECTAGGGLYLKNNSSRALIRNAHRTRGQKIDGHIEIRGCFLNGNRNNQPSAKIVRPDVPPADSMGESNKESDGTYMSGLQFFGVDYLGIHDITVWNTRAFGVHVANASWVDIRNVTIDHGGTDNADNADYINTDGLHFKGPLHFVSIDSVKLRVGDDGIALNPNDYETNDITTRNDFGPYVGQGPITDVTISNVNFVNAACGIRILSTNERVDRVIVSNVVGTISGFHLITIGHFMNKTGFGNIGKLVFENVNVDRIPDTRFVARDSRLDLPEDDPWFGEANSGVVPLINVNGRVELLQITGLFTQVVDRRPILRIGPDAKIAHMSVDLAAYDPTALGNILQIEKGGQVQDLRLSLDWDGLDTQPCRSPIINHGGKISRIRWASGSLCSRASVQNQIAQ